MYAYVVRSFTEGLRPSVAYLYKVETKNLAKGDVVLLDSVQGKPGMGVFYKYVEEDNYNYRNLERHNLIKKVHTNTLKSIIKKRFEKYGDFKLNIKNSKAEKKRRKQRYKKIQQFFDPEHQYDAEHLYREIMKMICLGNPIPNTSASNISFYFEDKVLILEETEHGYLFADLFLRERETRWITSTKGIIILDDLLAKTERPIVIC